MAFASNEAGEEVLLLDSKHCLWQNGMFRPLDFTQRAKLPPGDTLVIMEVEPRFDGKLRATRWAPLYVMEGHLKFFNKEKGFGFVITPAGDVFVHQSTFKGYKDGLFVALNGESNLPVERGTVVVVRLSERTPHPTKAPYATEWATKQLNA